MQFLGGLVGVWIVAQLLAGLALMIVFVIVNHR